MGPSHFTWIEQKLLQVCPWKKSKLSIMLSVIWGGKGKEEIWGICLEGGLSSIPDMSLSPCHLYLWQWKVDACCFQTQICHSCPFVLILNGYKLLPNIPGTQGLALHYQYLLPWWWGYQETSTRKSRGNVLRGCSISRQAVIVCKVKISGNENIYVWVLFNNHCNFTFISFL